jgi:hypothetical protein
MGVLSIPSGIPPAECERLVVELSGVNDSIASELEFVTSFLRAFASLRPEDIEAAHQELERQLSQEGRGASDA